MSSPVVDEGPALHQPSIGNLQAKNFQKVLLALFGAIVFSTFMTVIGLALGVRGGDVACLLWAALAVTVAFVPLALDIGRPAPQRHIFLSMLSISFMVNFVVPVLTNYIPAVGPMDPAAMGLSNLLPRDIARGQWMAILGLLCLFLGYAIPLRALMRSLLPTHANEWAHGAGLVATCSMIFVGWVVFLANAAGFVPAALGSGLIGGISSSILAGSALLTASYLKYRSRAALLLLVILIPITTLIMFLTGSKTAIMMPAAMVVMTSIVMRRQIRIRWVITGILALTLLYPVAQFWRHDILQMNTLAIGDIARNPGPALQRTAAFLSSSRIASYFSLGLEATGRRLDVIGISSVIIRDTPSVTPFQYGRTLALVPIGFIPRMFWPDKPVVQIGQWINENYTVYGYLSETNLAPSWIGEFYLNFGIAGVTIGMSVLGLMLRVMHEILMRPQASITMIAVSVILMSKLLIGIQGSLVDVINAPVLNLIPLFVAHLIMRLIGGVRSVALEESQP